jgi:hypothetical protein
MFYTQVLQLLSQFATHLKPSEVSLYPEKHFVQLAELVQVLQFFKQG